jgi:hypothetical protein
MSIHALWNPDLRVIQPPKCGTSFAGALGTAALSAARNNNGYLSACHRRIVAGGKQRAIVAVEVVSLRATPPRDGNSCRLGPTRGTEGGRATLDRHPPGRGEPQLGARHPDGSIADRGLPSGAIRGTHCAGA